MLHLTHTTITVTHRCTLKCKLCASYSPFFSPTPHFDIDLLKRTVDAYFETVDFVDKFTMSGGEPLCHSELDWLVTHLHRYASQIGTAEIITNGTLVPPERLVESLRLWGKQITIMVDNYGELSRNLPQIQKVLGEADIPHRVRCYYGEEAHKSGWVDYGDFSQKRTTPDELRKQYETCVHPKSVCIWELRGGEMHICARAHTMMYLSPLADQIGEILQRRGIPYEVRTYYGENCHCGGWIDLGNLELKQPTKAEQIELYKKCAYNSSLVSEDYTSLTRTGIIVCDGLLAICGGTYYAMRHGLVERSRSGGLIDLLDPSKSVQQKREEFIKLLQSESLPACAYCNGMCEDSVRYMPAEQLPREN